MFHHAFTLVAIVGLLLRKGQCAFDIAYGDDSDLSNFVTRPELRAPILEVKLHDEESVSPNYYFVGPYATLYQHQPHRAYYEPCQTGPHIYDSRGDLVWSGACLFRNKNMADFRATRTANGTFVMSGIQIDLDADDKRSYGDGKTSGRGLLIDDTYQTQSVVYAPSNAHDFNMHELQIADGGRSALHLLWQPEYIDIDAMEIEGRKAGWVDNMGFREVEISSGKTLFDWWALGNVPVTDSTWPVSGLEGPALSAWDYFHATSVDKSPEGDYLLSARHTDCIYKISGRDKSIVWRLGGKSSDFELQDDLAFSRQHDARFIQPESIGHTPAANVEYISLFNNAADELQEVRAKHPSSGLVLRLDTSNMSAKVIRQTLRPDHGSTLISGNSQILSNGNSLTSWDNSGWVSEHDADGRLVAEASFASHRFSNYRTYKQDWQARPSETELALECLAWGSSPEKATTVCYVSWNGATEVRSWRFYSESSAGTSASLMAAVEKNGFETKIESKGYSSHVYVEALDAMGAVLGRSLSATAKTPKHWPGIAA